MLPRAPINVDELNVFISGKIGFILYIQIV